MHEPGATYKDHLRRVFIGPHGIRSGWKALIFISGAMLLGMTTGKIIHLIFPTLHDSHDNVLRPYPDLRHEAIMSLLVMAMTFAMAWGEKRSPWSYGLNGPHRARLLATGMAAGFLSLSSLISLLYISGFLIFDGVGLHGADRFFYGFIWFLNFFGTGFVEETAFRGYLQTNFTRHLGFWPATILTSLLFAAAHLGNIAENPTGIVLVFGAGLIFCLLLRRSGSLWLGIGFHTAWDWAQSYFYGTADSGFLTEFHLLNTHLRGNAWLCGGSAGPEGSVLAVPVMLGGLLFSLWLGKSWGLIPPALPPGRYQDHLQ